MKEQTEKSSLSFKSMNPPVVLKEFLEVQTPVKAKDTPKSP